MRLRSAGNARGLRSIRDVEVRVRGKDSQLNIRLCLPQIGDFRNV
jgi:hypothetical protein